MTAPKLPEGFLDALDEISTAADLLEMIRMGCHAVDAESKAVNTAATLAVYRLEQARNLLYRARNELVPHQEPIGA